ncbi:transposable element Tcb1 transposase [Trichonephila clavipes]|nr:transposable element Tcb1 transposase [Trichonephila clavipes]
MGTYPAGSIRGTWNPQSVISRLWQRFQDDVTAKRNRRSTASDLPGQISTTTGTTVLRQIVYRRLGRIGLYARRPFRCVPLTTTHCRLRLNWSREHELRTSQQWSCLMFSDESRFSLQSDSRRTLIWRVPECSDDRFMDDNTRTHRANIVDKCLQSDDLYHPYGLASILTGLEFNRACVGYA